MKIRFVCFNCNNQIEENLIKKGMLPRCCGIFMQEEWYDCVIQIFEDVEEKKLKEK